MYDLCMTNAPATPVARHFEIVTLDAYDSYQGNAPAVVYESEWNEEATNAQHADAVAALVADAPAALITKLRRRKTNAEFVVTARPTEPLRINGRTGRVLKPRTRKSTPPATRKENDMTTTMTAPIAKGEARRQRAAVIAKSRKALEAKAAAPTVAARKARASAKAAPLVTVAELAALLSTTPRALRSFLRSTDQGTGKGSRYSFTARQVDAITKAWLAR